MPSTPTSTPAKFQVCRSPVHGLGLFATQRIAKGEMIGRYEGPTVDHVGDHVLWVYDEDTGREYGIDGQNELRYVNHSRKPNASFYGDELEALRAIRPGEEITHDYGWEWAGVQ
jgi:SET domain-containing protein